MRWSEGVLGISMEIVGQIMRLETVSLKIFEKTWYTVAGRHRSVY